MNNKPFLLYPQHGKAILRLTIEERGKLLTAILEYKTSGSVQTELSPAAEAVFGVICDQFETDDAKYQAVCEKNRANINKRWHTSVYDRIPPYTMDTKHTDNDYDNDNDNDYDYDYDSTTDIKSTVKHTLSNSAERAFDRFWKVYPKKKERAEALREFKKINPSEDLLEVMIAAVENQKTWESWKTENGRFIPHPAKWLSRGQWQDEQCGAAKYDPEEDMKKFFGEG